ncbi:LysR substrate-binding domain-containing protein [Acinetobacter rudis]|uniref:HTH lysR-type domain-containing protein n=1 Tax=Acinetobacter rudis CIP 110305 TaxID=421052 RepID=S3MW87_9GAMM|nr:LysR substrate-binding domain-containing protein [Acinetobacter rudis]EPF70728.1 hypothetical protein F945_02972 [Acinetobacter rudis CIP 110305]
MNNIATVPINLDMDALRAFVKGIELGNFNLAAQYLCRSPAAISAQLKKLEQQTGCKLLRKQGRSLELTPNGELLLSYAKNILENNDTVLLKLKQNVASGIIKFGLQEDFSESTLQQLIAQFMLQHPNIQFQIQVDRNFNLIDKVNKQELDLALVWNHGSMINNFEDLQTLKTQWLYCPKENIEKILKAKTSIPLILLQQPCLLRQMALQLLEENGIPWHIAYECNSAQALWPAVRAGIGISLRSVFNIPSDIEILEDEYLPKLNPLTYGLYLSTVNKKSSIVQSFQNYIKENLKLK